LEKRKELDHIDQVVCPKCGSGDLDCDESPERAKCNACGCEIKSKIVLIWNE
jgi:transcription initiation factor TFIIIB Brf1 subunit/transcription initiation factor TFIIB